MPKYRGTLASDTFTFDIIQVRMVSRVDLSRLHVRAQYGATGNAIEERNCTRLAVIFKVLSRKGKRGRGPLRARRGLLLFRREGILLGRLPRGFRRIRSPSFLRRMPLCPYLGIDVYRPRIPARRDRPLPRRRL